MSGLVISGGRVVDPASGMDAIGAHIRRSTWAEIRKAQKRGITIREGGEKDVPAFFQLMLATCASLAILSVNAIVAVGGDMLSANWPSRVHPDAPSRKRDATPEPAESGLPPPVNGNHSDT